MEWPPGYPLGAPDGCLVRYDETLHGGNLARCPSSDAMHDSSVLVGLEPCVRLVGAVGLMGPAAVRGPLVTRCSGGPLGGSLRPRRVVWNVWQAEVPVVSQCARGPGRRGGSQR
ncbi:hypothetical protein FRAAL0657 [Frankia alni ACN14a]|uniref:Uncharacterized protein n=1 Tax=Frankia alni (strain DSM 45986 / CECT 9034 / ACN14a) TaxID=326424 RepID=Q0RSX3_FRAAA|nr:hypothetical protein FRAAL0657 [Frankia alni ACN14a]